MRRILHSYEHTDAPYQDVVTLLRWRAEELILDSFAGDIEEQPPAVAMELGGFDVMRDVTVTVGELEPFGAHTVRLPFQWEAARHAAWFPKVDAALEVTALSNHPPRTELAFFGSYGVPLGLVGTIADGLVGHRVAEEIGRRLLLSIRDHIDTEINALPSLLD